MPKPSIEKYATVKENPAAFWRGRTVSFKSNIKDSPIFGHIDGFDTSDGQLCVFVKYGSKRLALVAPNLISLYC